MEALLPSPPSNSPIAPHDRTEIQRYLTSHKFPIHPYDSLVYALYLPPLTLPQAFGYNHLDDQYQQLRNVHSPVAVLMHGLLVGDSYFH